MEERTKGSAGEAIFGVDVGNGYGKVSVLLKENADPMNLLPDSLLAGMPSTAYVAPNGEIAVYGARQKRPSRAVEAVKTKLCDSFIVLEETKGHPYQVSPCDVYAAIARDLMTLANEKRCKHGEKPIYKLVLTYPASFKDRPDLLGKLKSSVESVKLDGHSLTVSGMISEPSAVAIDYLYYMRHLASKPIKAEKYTVLVYDLGHGTFDTAVVTAFTDSKKECELHCQNGDGEIGGKKFDDLLYAELAAQVRQQAGAKASFDREALRKLAVEIKHDLSTRDISEQTFFAGDNDEEILLKYTRQEFNQLIQPQLMRTMELVEATREEAAAKGVTIDAIVLSGGSSNIPVIRDTLCEVVENRLPVEIYRPSFGVTFGAARLAYDISNTPDPDKPSQKITIQQHCERSSGIRYDGEVHFLLNEDAVLPCTSEKLDFVSASSGRTNIHLRRARTLMPGATKAQNSDCMDILQVPMELPPEQPCSLRLRMDTNRCIYVDCTLPDGKVITKSTFYEK